MTKRIPADVVAASYVELTVAIVTLEQRIEHLEAQLARILGALETQILAEQLAAIEAFKAAKGLA
jgi:hypothetical protein